jgi:hypothetical protein
MGPVSSVAGGDDTAGRRRQICGKFKQFYQFVTDAREFDGRLLGCFFVWGADL